MSVNKRQPSGALIPIAGLGTYTNNDLKQYTNFPTATAANEGMIVQYAGSDTAELIHGGIYTCQENGGTFAWVLISQEKLIAGNGIDISGNVISSKIFVGTTAEWTAEPNKSRYNIVILTDE